MARHTIYFVLGLFMVAACSPQPVQQQSLVTPSLDLGQITDLGAANSNESQSSGEDCISIDDEVQVASGREIYTARCVECHGVNGEGQFGSTLATDAQGRLGAPPHNDTGHTWHHGDDILLRVIRDGGMGAETMFASSMPAFGDDLSNTDITAVIAYIKSLWSEEIREIQCARS